MFQQVDGLERFQKRKDYAVNNLRPRITKKKKKTAHNLILIVNMYFVIKPNQISKLFL